MRKLLFILLLLIPVWSSAQFMTGEAGIIYVSTSNAYETQTTTYLNAMASAGASFTSAQKDSINRFIKDLKGLSNPRYTTNNVISRVNIIYPFLTGVSATDKINMVNPGTYNYTETGSPTYSTGTLSIAFNGTTQYINTTHTCNGSATLAGSDFTGFGVHRIDANTDANATIGALGGGNSYMQIQNASFKLEILDGQTANGGSNSEATARLWWASWSSSTALNGYYNKTKMTASSPTYSNTPTRSVLIGAFNNGTIGFGGPCTVDFYIEVTGTWSDAEEAGIYDAAKALRASFSITWN